MTLEEIMKQKTFVVVGNTIEKEKYAYLIKNGLINKGYKVYAVGKELASINDVNDDIDILDLCIHPVKGLQLLKECTKKFKCVVIQPGAGSEEIIEYLNDNHIDYLEGCLLVGMKLYSK